MKLFTQCYLEGNTECWILPLFCTHSCEHISEVAGLWQKSFYRPSRCTYRTNDTNKVKAHLFEGNAVSMIYGVTFL